MLNGPTTVSEFTFRRGPAGRITCHVKNVGPGAWAEVPSWARPSDASRIGGVLPSTKLGDISYCTIIYTAADRRIKVSAIYNNGGGDKRFSGTLTWDV